jgi:glycosyltransferase involved in cell wall biosynthesis
VQSLATVLVAIPVVTGTYAYAAYPLLLWIASRFAGRREQAPGSELSTVSIVIPAYNEERNIAGAIDAVLAQDYPPHLMHLLVLSDASTDDTDRIVASYEDTRVELLRMPERGGKTKAENAAAARLRGEIIVNTDSSIRLHRAAVRQLVTRMADPGVGVASGCDVSIPADVDSANPTEAGYVGYEMLVRSLETRTGGIVGASGSCYAIRAALHRIPIRDELSRDFSAALTAREHGYVAVSVDEAICFVSRTGSLQREYRRKVRTIARGMATLYARRALLNPFRHGAFAWKLFSHKICRWFLPLSVLPAVVGLVVLAGNHGWARLTLLAGAVIVTLAIAGAYWPAHKSMPRLVSVAAFGLAANLAVIVAFWRFLRGQPDAVWEPTRRAR